MSTSPWLLIQDKGLGGMTLDVWDWFTHSAWRQRNDRIGRKDDWVRVFGARRLIGTATSAFTWRTLICGLSQLCKITVEVLFSQRQKHAVYWRLD